MKVIFKGSDKRIKILSPSNWLSRPNGLTDIQWEVLLAKITADKDIPEGNPYKIMYDSELPDIEFMSCWEVDDSFLTDGIGLSKEQFEKKYPNLKGVAVQ